MAVGVFGGEIFNVQNSLNRTQFSLSRALERLSSGRRINSAADDAAGLAIVQSFSAQTRSFAVASRNAQDAVSSLQTAEGGFESQSENLIRLRELATQAANGTLSASDRQAIQSEVNQLTQEIQRTAETTEFNGQNLLAATNTQQFQVGIGGSAENRISVTINASTAAALGVENLDVSTQSAAQSALTTIDNALTQVSTNRSAIGASQSRLESANDSTQVAFENVTNARSRIEDADIAQESANLAALSIRNQAGISVLASSLRSRSNVLRLLGLP